MSTLLFVFTGALVARLFGFPVAGPAPRAMRALVCRGAANIDLRIDQDPSPSHERYVRFVLRYQPGQQPVGSAFENLPPGSCSWNPNNFPGVPPEPGLVYIDIVRAVQDYAGGRADTTIKAAENLADATTFPRYMKVPDHYWLFYMDDVTHISNSFMAAKYTPRQPVIPDLPAGVVSTGPTGQSTQRAGTVAEKADPTSGPLRDANPTLDAARVPLTFHEVVRKPTEYWLRFGARAKSGVTAEYGISPAIRKSGRLTFHQPFPWTVRVLSEKGFAAEYSTAPVRGLTQGKKYYFVINVPAGGPGLPAQEYSGEFWALAQHVTVRFTRIDVLNDSDKIDSGEITFQYHLAPGDKNDYSCSVPEVCHVRHAAVSWESGSQNPIDVILSQKITTPTIRIWVAGMDSDHLLSHTEWGNIRWTKNYGRSTNFYDDNNARAQLTLTVVPEQTVFVSRNAFKLRSFDGAVLMYEVHGQAEAIWK